jgi:hypothetical protein
MGELGLLIFIIALAAAVAYVAVRVAGGKTEKSERPLGGKQPPENGDSPRGSEPIEDR